MADLIICPECFVASRPNAKFCRACGSKLGSDNCSNCQSPLKVGAKFCTNCGTPVKASTPGGSPRVSPGRSVDRKFAQRTSRETRPQTTRRNQSRAGSQPNRVRSPPSRSRRRTRPDPHHTPSSPKLFEKMSEDEVLSQYAAGIHNSKSILYTARMKNELRELEQMIFRLSRYRSYFINDLVTLEKETNDVIKHLRDGEDVHGYEEIASMAEDVLQKAYEQKLHVLEWMTEGLTSGPVAEAREEWQKYLERKRILKEEMKVLELNGRTLMTFQQWVEKLRQLIESGDFQGKDVGELFSSNFSISIHMSEMQRKVSEVVSHFGAGWRTKVLPVIYFFEDFSLLDQEEREHISATDLHEGVLSSLSTISELIHEIESELKAKQMEYDTMVRENRELRGRYIRAMREAINELTDSKILSLRSDKEREEIRLRDEEKVRLLKETLIVDTEDSLQEAQELRPLNELQPPAELVPIQALVEPVQVEESTTLVELEGLMQVTVPDVILLSPSEQEELVRRLHTAYYSVRIKKKDENEIEFLMLASDPSMFRLCRTREHYVLTTELKEYRGKCRKLILESSHDFDPTTFNPFEKIRSFSLPHELRESFILRRELGERFLRIPGFKKFLGEQSGSSFYMVVEFSEIHKEGLRAVMSFVQELSFTLHMI